VAACELGSEVLDQLFPVATAPHLSVLVGAGASIAAGLPSWDELALRLLSGAGAIDDAATARAYIASQDPTVAAEAARAVCEDWSTLVRQSLYGDAEDLYPRALHLAVANLAATRPDAVSLLTVNFDDLLEDAVRDAVAELGRTEQVESRAAASPRAGSGTHEVQHLHGLLPKDGSRAAGDLVLTLSDFNNLAATAHPWQASALTEAMSRGPLLLVGTSYRDVDIRQWLHAVRVQLDAHGGNVVALVARESLGLSRREFADVGGALRQQWSAIGIHALLLQDHAEAAQVLRELPAVLSDGYRVPAMRTADFFAQQLDAFSNVQAQHSELLDADRDNLPLGAGLSSDLTLWLADGSDSLVRWASHDRVYRTPAKLRRVPLGHDSPWAAARAMSQSEVLVQRPERPYSDIRRWRTVVAAPVTASLPGGPNLVVGALSAATTARLDQAEETEWRTALADLVETWAGRLGIGAG
jgi:hypothetical protein